MVILHASSLIKLQRICIYIYMPIPTYFGYKIFICALPLHRSMISVKMKQPVGYRTVLSINVLPLKFLVSEVGTDWAIYRVIYLFVYLFVCVFLYVFVCLCLN